jgi:hypothetical protein
MLLGMQAPNERPDYRQPEPAIRRFHGGPPERLPRHEPLRYTADGRVIEDGLVLERGATKALPGAKFMSAFVGNTIGVLPLTFLNLVGKAATWMGGEKYSGLERDTSLALQSIDAVSRGSIEGRFGAAAAAVTTAYGAGTVMGGARLMVGQQLAISAIEVPTGINPAERAGVYIGTAIGGTIATVAGLDRRDEQPPHHHHDRTPVPRPHPYRGNDFHGA